MKVGELKTQMTSLQIAELTGKEHNHVMRDIRVLLEQLDMEGQSNFGQSSYLNSQNKEHPMYVLNYKGVLCLASGYDAALRMKIINRWEELELSHKPKIPQSFSEALQLAADQAKELEKKDALLLEQAPKVTFANAVVGSRSSCLIGELAKIITQNGCEIGQNRLFQWMRDNNYLGKNGERYNIPNQQYIEQGLFELKKGVRSGNDGVLHTTITVKTTGKGQMYFINKFLNNK